MEKLKQNLELNGWDGDWYKRAYFDDGSPLGSVTNKECSIDSIAQSWAVISGAAQKERMLNAMNSVMKHLVRKDSKLILLFTPPFDKTPKNPGYIKGYVPGVRENGGQYTHAAVWVIMAWAQLGEGNKAMDLLSMLNPILHTINSADLLRYKTEPYVLAGDVYSGGNFEGRGGWSWYTGSSSWYYRSCLESLLGFRRRGNKLKIVPCIPREWKEYKIVYLFGASKYVIKVNNHTEQNTGSVLMELDGLLVQGGELKLVDDGLEHEVVITIIVTPNAG